MTSTRTDLDPLTVPVMLRRELIEQGWNDKAIARLLRSATWRRVRHGAYVDVAQWNGLDHAGRHLALARTVLRQARTDVALSHCSAAVLRGAPTWGLPLSEVDLTRIDGRLGRREASVRQHSGALTDEDLTSFRDLPVTSPTRVALEVTTQLAVEPAMGVVSHLLHTRQTTPELLEKRYRSTDNPLTHWPGSRTTDLVLRLSDSRFESIGEVRTFYAMFKHGLPMPIPQYEILDGSGRVVAVVDFAWPDIGVFLEFDGRIKYEKLLREGERASDVVVREKKREDLVRHLTTWRCIRVVWSELDDSARLADRVSKTLFPS
jgi:hypothetical protein